jgi:acyl dehydratase
VSSFERPFGRYFEEFEVGDVYKHWPGKTITEADDHLFCMITMNHHPLHTNAWFAEHETVHHKNVVVGNLVYSLVLGMSVPDVSGRRSPTSRSSRWSTASRPSTATPSTPRRACSKRPLEIQERPGHRAVETKGFNQDGLEVCYFRRKVMVWKRDFAPERRRPYSDDVWS